MRNNEHLPRGGQTFGITSPPLPPVREKELAPPPTPEEVKAANAGEYAGETRTVERVGRNRLLKIALGGGAVVAGGTVAYEALPAFHQAVDSAFLNHIKGKSLSTEASTNTEVFNPTATEGVIKPNMIEILPQEEIDRLYPTAFEKLREDDNRTIIKVPQDVRNITEERRADFPDYTYEIGSDKNTLQLQYPLDLSRSSNPNAEISFKKSLSGVLDEKTRIALEKEGYYSGITFYGVPKETIIYFPIDGFLTLDAPSSNPNPAISKGGFIDLQAPNGNIYRLAIGGTKGNDLDVLKPLVKAPNFAPEQNHKSIGTYGLQGKKGQVGFQTVKDLDELTITVLMARKGKVGEEVDFRQPSLPTTLEIITSPNNMIASSINN